MQNLLTIPQVAERLQIGVYTVRTLLWSGKLKGHRINKMWRVSEEQLHAYLNPAPKVKPKAPPSYAPITERLDIGLLRGWTKKSDTK